MAKGLSAESITVAAAELIEQYGRSGFSMRLLADTMGVKPPRSIITLRTWIPF